MHTANKRNLSSYTNDDDDDNLYEQWAALPDGSFRRVESSLESTMEGLGLSLGATAAKRARGASTEASPRLQPTAAAVPPRVVATSSLVSAEYDDESDEADADAADVPASEPPPPPASADSCAVEPSPVASLASSSSTSVRRPKVPRTSYE